MNTPSPRAHIYSDLASRRTANDFDYTAQTTFMVARVHRILRMAVLEAFVPYQVGMAEFAVMSIVRAAQPVTNAELARLTQVSPQATSKLVSTLLARGVFERLDGPGGLQPIVLTESGLELHTQLLRAERSVTGELAQRDPAWRDLLEEVVKRGEELLSAASAS